MSVDFVARLRELAVEMRRSGFLHWADELDNIIAVILSEDRQTMEQSAKVDVLAACICCRCGRQSVTAKTGETDQMVQPNGQPCGGVFGLSGVPSGSRTRVSGLKARRPGPLDDRDRS